MTIFISEHTLEENLKLTESLLSNREFRNKYKNYKDRAVKKNIQFELSPIDFHSLVTGECYICNVPYSNKYQGVDRLDNDKGYTLTNVKTCCWDCNRAKSNMSLNEFATWLGRINKDKVKNIDDIIKELELYKNYQNDDLDLIKNDKYNNDLLFSDTVFYPKILYAVQLPDIPLYVKHFAALGNIYEFIDYRKENNVLPDDIKVELLIDKFLILKNKKPQNKRFRANIKCTPNQLKSKMMRFFGIRVTEILIDNLNLITGCHTNVK